MTGRLEVEHFDERGVRTAMATEAAVGDASQGVLLPYQQRWVADRSPVKVCEKSRRVGLTWGEAADSALTAAEASGQDTWYIGYNKDMAQEFIETCAMWAKAFAIAAGEMEDAGDVLDPVDKEKGILAFRIRFASGHKIVALSSRPSNLRGKQGRVVLDEFAFHPDPAELLKAALALTIWGGQIIVISTHDGDDNPFNELIVEIRSGRVPYSLHRITFDDAIADGLYRRVCQKLKRPWSPAAEVAWRKSIYDIYRSNADEELEVIPRTGGGSFIPAVLLEKSTDADVPLVRWEQPTSYAALSIEERRRICQEFLDEEVAPLVATLNPNLLTFYGGDFGRTGDLTVDWLIQQRPDLTRHTALVIELRNIPHEQQVQVLFFVLDRAPRFVAGKMDAGGNGSYRAEVAWQRYGARIERVMLSQEWYRENMPRYKAAFEDGAMVLPKDADIVGDHRSLKFERGIAKPPEKSRKGANGWQRHADAAIAGCFAYAASLADVPEYDYSAVPKPGRMDDARTRDDESSARFAGRGAY